MPKSCKINATSFKINAELSMKINAQKYVCYYMLTKDKKNIKFQVFFSNRVFFIKGQKKGKTKTMGGGS